MNTRNTKKNLEYIKRSFFPRGNDTLKSSTYTKETFSRISVRVSLHELLPKARAPPRGLRPYPPSPPACFISSQPFRLHPFPPSTVLRLSFPIISRLCCSECIIQKPFSRRYRVQETSTGKSAYTPYPIMAREATKQRIKAPISMLTHVRKK